MTRSSTRSCPVDTNSHINAGAQPRGPLPDRPLFPNGDAARVGCSGLLGRLASQVCALIAIALGIAEMIAHLFPYGKHRKGFGRKEHDHGTGLDLAAYEEHIFTIVPGLVDNKLPSRVVIADE